MINVAKDLVVTDNSHRLSCSVAYADAAMEH